MNCPSRTDEPEGTGFNQNPDALAADLTVRQDLNGRANSRLLRRIASSDMDNMTEDEPRDLRERNVTGSKKNGGVMLERTLTRATSSHVRRPRETLEVSKGSEESERSGNQLKKYSRSVLEVVKNFGKFVGPGFMVR
jgi:metal iron transporter